MQALPHHLLKISQNTSGDASDERDHGFFPVDIDRLGKALRFAALHALGKDVFRKRSPFKHLFRAPLRRIVHADPVSDLESRLFAHGLDLGDELALAALVQQLLGQARIKRDGDAAARDRGIALRRLGEDLQVLFQQNHGAV